MGALSEWILGWNVQYHAIALSAITTILVLILGHKIRPWIACRLGLHKWEHIDLRRRDSDVPSYGRVCWDDCYVQVWTSSGFVDRVDTYVIVARPLNARERRVAYVDDFEQAMEYIWAQELPGIKKGANNLVIFRIFEEATRVGFSGDSALRNEFFVYRGDLDELFNCPMYRRRQSYDLKRWFRREKLRSKSRSKSVLKGTWKRLRR